MKKNKLVNHIFWLSSIGFISAFLFLILYLWILTLITFNDIVDIVTNWYSPILLGVFAVLIPLWFKKQVQQIIKDDQQQKPILVRKKLYLGRYVFLVTSILYGCFAYLTFHSVQLLENQLLITLFACIFFTVNGPSTFLIFIYQKLESLCENTSTNELKHFSGISTKIKTINTVTTLGSIYFLIVGTHLLLTKNITSDGILNISIPEISYRLTGVAIITALFIIVPMITLGQKFVKQIHELKNHMVHITHGQLTEHLPKSSFDELGIMTESVNIMRDSLKKVIQEIQVASKNINEVGNIVQSSSSNLEYASLDQVQDTADISNSIEEMTINIGGNHDRAEQCDTLSSEIGKLAKESYVVVHENVTAIQEIADKVNVINEIANQTNLLAINATIESASVGEYGKGFAVVAKEVRNLAEKSKVSAKEINELASSCLELVERNQKSITTLQPKAENSAEIAAEISKISEQTHNKSTQINEKIIHLNSVTRSNSEISVHLSTQSKNLNDQVHALNMIVDQLKV